MNRRSLDVEQILLNLTSEKDVGMTGFHEFEFRRLEGIGHDPVQVHRLRDRNTPAGHGQQILDDGGRPFTALQNTFRIFLRPASLRNLPQKQFGITHQNAQHIVQIMGHATGQNPQGFHLFCTLKTLLHVLAIGVVADALDGADDLAL